MERKPVRTILVDFDGTISQTDVGNALFHLATKGAFQGVVSSWKAGEVSSRECLITECSLARITRDDLLSFALDQAVDSTFRGFFHEAERRGIQVCVVSDGLDVYIRTILEREGMANLPVESNRIRFSGNRLLPSFPYAGRGCGACGNCKGGAVAAYRSQGGVGFIGDGMSDRCGARVADWVFAKQGRDLIRTCKEESIPFHSFGTFGDILSILEWS